MDIFEYINLPKWSINIPFEQKRNTSLNARLKHLEKKLLKKLQYVYKLEKTQIQRTLDLPNHLMQQATNLKTLQFKQLNLKHIMFIRLAFLEQTDYLTKAENKNLFQEIPDGPNNFNISLNKTKLYTSKLAISLTYAINKGENLPNIVYAIAIMSYILHIFSTLIYDISYCTLSQNIPPETQKPYNVPTIPLFMLDTPLAIYNLLKNTINPPSTKFKSVLDYISPFYRKSFKKMYICKTTVYSLANFINSKKKAKKYLRILQKRLRLYKKKKPKWI